ncbi:C-type lectin 1-like [Ahaetulla prasina]|uniref:C-type lectin 1-like n=1 Tax=Ahaetulla prasina TaxID=499056 RepID=UPI0026475C1F|nr:C-type lectin 1-like [Ahaetulla prasina]
MGRFIFVSFGLLLVALSLNGAGADHHCPSDWTSYNEFCYKVYNRSVTWNAAERFCMQQQEHSHLASIHSKPEADFMANLASHGANLQSNVWIGLNDPEKKNTWQWSDGSKLNYKSWMPGEPNNHANMEYCAVLSAWSRYVGWNDQDCGSRHNFVCKYQPRMEVYPSDLPNGK